MSFEEKLGIIDEMNKQIAAHGPLDADMQKRINYKFRLEWNYNSNIMEGNSLTKQETRSVMVGNITVGGKPLKDVLEMKGHDEVVKDIIKMGSGELNISEARIKEIHKGIMYEEAPEDQKKIGVWKTQNNYLYNYKKERVDFAPFSEVPEDMHQLINSLNREKGKIKRGDKDAMHSVAMAFNFHLDYITIHPFYDGNGRTARIFTNLILIAYGYPPLYIKLDEKDRYYQYLADVQEYGGAPDLFYDFMADMLIRSLQIVLDAIAGKPIEEPDDVDKKIAMWKKKLSNITDEPVAKSLDRISNLYLQCLSGLLDKYSAKLHKNFNDLFTEWQVIGSVDGNSNANKNKIAIDDYIKKMLTGTPNSFALLIFMKGFKKNGPNAFSISTQIEIRFEEYTYKVRLNQNVVAEKFYNQLLTEEEQDKIIQDGVSNTFDQIRALMK